MSIAKCQLLTIANQEKSMIKTYLRAKLSRWVAAVVVAVAAVVVVVVCSLVD